MAVLTLKIVIITCLFTCKVLCEESEAYLTVNALNAPLLENKIEASQGQNLIVDCAVYPPYHSVFWSRNSKQSTYDATLNFVNLNESDAGAYSCQSPTAKLEKTVHIVVNRFKRDDDTFKYPGGPFSFQDALEIQREYIEKYNKEIQEGRHEVPPLVPEWKEPDRRQSHTIKTIAIVIGSLVVAGGFILVIYMLCRRMNRRAPTYIATQTGPLEQRPYRPIETHIAPYPPTSSNEQRPLNAPSSYRPTETRIAPYPPTSPSAPFVEPETPPPPSYNEAVSNTKPSRSVPM